MVGAGLLVAVSQLPPLLGLPARGDGHQHFLYRLWQTLTQGAGVRPACVAVGLATLLLVVVLRTLKKRLRVEMPDHLLALLAAFFLGGPPGLGGPEIRAPPRELPRLAAGGQAADALRPAVVALRRRTGRRHRLHRGVPQRRVLDHGWHLPVVPAGGAAGGPAAGDRAGGQRRACRPRAAAGGPALR